MIEDDLWRGSNDPDQMRSLIRLLPIASNERKLRLWACACCRRIWHLVTDIRCHQSVEVAEQAADGLASADELRLAHSAAGHAEDDACAHWEGVIIAAGVDINAGYEVHRGHYVAYAAESAFALASSPFLGVIPHAREEGPESSADKAAAAVANVVDPQVLHWWPSWTSAGEGAYGEEMAAQAVLLRDIFGNPFHPATLDPRWQTETVVALATGIYAERAFDRLPILADALEEAGCDNLDILNHCRGPGPHVLGCWVVDLVLGKLDQ